MHSIFDFRRQIREHCKAKNYNEALSFFKANKASFEISEIAKEYLLIADIVTCLRHTKHFDAAFIFLNNYGITINENTPEVILNAYAWLIYDILKKENSTELIDEPEEFSFDENTSTSASVPEKTDLVKKIEETILLLQHFDSVFSKNVLDFLFKATLKLEKKKLRPNWDFIVTFCDNVDPEILSTDCKTIQVTRKGQLKDMELSSSKEEWFACMSKALFQTKQIERCYDVSKKALETFTVFHYGYDIWFARRIALCKKQLGNIDEAISELETILRKKREWFILKELAEMYFEKGKITKAFNLAKQGMLAHGELDFKIELIELLGILHKRNGEELLAFQHFSLACLIKEENKWRLNDTLLQNINSFIDMPVYNLSQKDQLIKVLEKTWHINDNSNKYFLKNSNNTPNVRCTGVVKKMLKPTDLGKQGFITKDSGEDVFFFLRKEHNLFDLIKEGIKVSFESEPDKNGKGDRAKSIKLIQ